MYFCYFYPVGLDLPRRRQPWLSILLIGSMIGTFVWQRWFADTWSVHPWDLVFYVGGARPWTAVTALFLHAGWLHLAGNLVYLMVLMPSLEDRLGRAGLLLVFLLTGVGGNLAHGIAAWQNWFGQGGLGILGVSGAISGLLGFALVRLPYARIAVAYWVFAPLLGQNRAGRKYLPLPVAVVLWLVLQVTNAMLAPESGSLVSYPAHLGGFGLGVLLALALGGLTEGRAESRLARARRYLERGEGWAAAGAYTEYLERKPDDLPVYLERARALILAGASDKAVPVYQHHFRSCVRAGRWDLALDTLAEGRRCRVGAGLTLTELADAAHRAEKVGRRDLATAIYMDLVLRGGRDPVRDRAWVRLVLLLHADPRRQAEATEWLDRARRELEPGAWRDYLEREFSPRSGCRADPATAPAGPLPAPGA